MLGCGQLVIHMGTELVSDVLQVAPSLRPTFLSSLGSRVHASAVRVSFHALVVPDDARLFENASGPATKRSAVAPLLSNPKKYALAVKELAICEPDVVDDTATQSVAGGGSTPVGRLAVDQYRPLDATDVFRILEACGHLERLTWASPFPPPDGLCEV